MIFNWKITAVPSWNCLLCLLVVYNRAVIKISQAFSLVPSHSPLSCRCYGGERGDSSESLSWSGITECWGGVLLVCFFFFKVLTFFKCLLILLQNVSMNYTSKWAFFSCSLKQSSLRFVWIWNFIQHLLHHFVPDFLLLTPCPVLSYT